MTATTNIELLKANAERLHDMLSRAFDILDSEEGSVKEEHADFIGELDRLLEEMRPVNEYLFDVSLSAAIRVKAKSKEEAVAVLKSIDANSANLGCFPDGEPIVCEVSIHEIEKDALAEINGVAV